MFSETCVHQTEYIYVHGMYTSTRALAKAQYRLAVKASLDSQRYTKGRFFFIDWHPPSLPRQFVQFVTSLGSSQIILKNAKTTPVASELSGVTLQFKGRYFKTLNDFCKTAGHTNPNAKVRKALMDHKFDAKDTLWWAKGCPRNYSRQLDAEMRTGAMDLAGSDMDEICLVADLSRS